jgi:hypothetical protein
MGAAIGGRHIVMLVTTTPIRQRTVARIMEVMVITIQRLTMTLPRVLMVGNRQPTVLTARQRAAPVTILILELTHAVLQFRHPMAVEAQHRHITRTPAPMLRRGRVRARTPSGEAPMFREGTKALPRAIIQQRMEQWRAPLIRREEKWPLPARSGETVRLEKQPAATCMPGTMATFTRTQVMVGRSTITEGGTQ